MLQFKRRILYVLLRLIGGAGVLCAGIYGMGWPQPAAGLAGGCLVSALYCAFMTDRIDRCDGQGPKKAVISMRFGWLVRLTFLVLSMVVCIRLSVIPLWAFVVGLLSFHFALLAFVGKMAAGAPLAGLKAGTRRGVKEWNMR